MWLDKRDIYLSEILAQMKKVDYMIESEKNGAMGLGIDLNKRRRALMNEYQDIIECEVFEVSVEKTSSRQESERVYTELELERITKGVVEKVLKDIALGK